MVRTSWSVLALSLLVGFVRASPSPADTMDEEDIAYSSTPEANFLKEQYSLCPGPDHGLLRVKNPFLYKWVGSYYDGTIETTITLSNSTLTCSAQAGTFNRTLSAVLSVLDSKYQTVPENVQKNPFIFLLNAWIPDVPFSGENLVPTQMPVGVLMDFESVAGFRAESNGGKYGDVNSPSVVDLSVGRSGEGWGFRGSYENSTEKQLGVDTSSFVYEFPTCNATQYANFLVQNYPAGADSSSPSVTASNANTTTLTGAFSSESAEFTISGQFAGHFDSWRLGDHKIDIALDKVLYGSYKMVFKGVLDTKHSHGLVVGSSPSWVPDANKTRDYACVQSGAGARGREVTWWLWVVLDVLLLTLWSGM
ncbi:unnamed protein product [Tuber aestivum]|uniref:GH16 domain-containing protein n=1 Tax=Tuber aestivum TaxID=59557 RepID=A0A292PXQ1_9PEZI|nr:unnamed protein product [Tuber aestivum]